MTTEIEYCGGLVLVWTKLDGVVLSVTVGPPNPVGWSVVETSTEDEAS